MKWVWVIINNSYFLRYNTGVNIICDCLWIILLILKKNWYLLIYVSKSIIPYLPSVKNSTQTNE